MKEGQSLTAIAAELERQLETRKDYIAPQGSLVVTPSPEKAEGVLVSGFNGNRYGLTDHAHGQLATHLDIPKKYYDRMKVEMPTLLSHNVNAWLTDDPKARRMVRTLDGKVRAFLSDKYRPLDNYDLMRVSLPVLKDKGAKVVSSEVTEKRLYVKAILPELCEAVPEGLALGQGHNFLSKDTVVAAITISNSEIGAGGVRIDAGFYKTKCTNLAIFAEGSMKKYHVGRSAGGNFEDAFEYFTDETRQQDDRAF